MAIKTFSQVRFVLRIAYAPLFLALVGRTPLRCLQNMLIVYENIAKNV